VRGNSHAAFLEGWVSVTRPGDSTMMWVKDQFKALKNIYQLLKPSGKFVNLIWPWTDFYWMPAEHVITNEKCKNTYARYSWD